MTASQASNNEKFLFLFPTWTKPQTVVWQQLVVGDVGEHPTWRKLVGLQEATEKLRGAAGTQTSQGFSPLISSHR